MNKSILLLDDNPSLRHMIKIAMENAGYTVLEAVNGLDGLTKAQETVFDCIVTDLKMPQMDGLAFIQELKKLPNVSCPIVVFSSITQEYLIQELLKAGATKILLKDESTPSELVEVINALVGHVPPAR